MENTARGVHCFYKWCFARKIRCFLIYLVGLCVGCFSWEAFANKPCELIKQGPDPDTGWPPPVPTYHFKEDKVDSDCNVNIKGRLWIEKEKEISINSVQAESLVNYGKLRVTKIDVYNMAAPPGFSMWTCMINGGKIEAESIKAECSSGVKHPSYWAIDNSGIIKAKDVFGKGDMDAVRAVGDPRQRGLFEVDRLMGVSEYHGGVFIIGGRIKAKTVIGISKKYKGIVNWQERGGSIKAKKILSLTKSWYPDQEGKHIPIIKKNSGDDKSR